MKIAGFNKISFVDYPGLIASVVFTPGCNFRCAYCHNRHIVEGTPPEIDEKKVFDYFERRSDMLQAVVVTGGEPTLHKDLPDFLKKARGFGLKTKLDTNGSNPNTIERLMDDGLVDYIAMDVKAPMDKYFDTAGAPVDVNAIQSSIRLLLEGRVNYEFRTTFAPPLTKEDMLALGQMIRGAKAYYLQQYRPQIGQIPAHPASLVAETAQALRDIVGVCVTRGL